LGAGIVALDRFLAAVTFLGIVDVDMKTPREYHSARDLVYE